MCGISGRISASRQEGPDGLLLMRDRLSHRGPDDCGLWLSADRRVALGHRRLSILDLSANGHQPMASPCGRFVIVFNGEVYNYVELREALAGEGRALVGSGDTEVVLAAYIHWGASCLTRFNGMFAFAIFDQGTAGEPPCLFMARDRVGKKPFYYRYDGAGLSFASELKGLDRRNELSLQALNHYLALGYVPGRLCIDAGVAKLPPAHAGSYRLDTGELKLWQYWNLPANEPDTAASESELVEEARRLLQDSVKLRLRSDVPVGVLLSGGLDSSLIAAAAARASSRPIKTFTVSFPGTRFDEAQYAELVARHLGSEHHVLSLPRASLDTLDELRPFLDEPIADSSLIPAYQVSKLTVGSVKVALGGDGGDELFGGYSDYATAVADAARLGWIPQPALRAAAKLVGMLPAGVRGRNRLFSLQGGPYQAIVWGTPYFDIALRRRILGSDAVAALGADLDAPERELLGLFEQGDDPIDSMTRTHFGSILPDDFLVKVDRASMAVSLELRCPLLDYRLVEFAFGKLSSTWKVRPGETRRLQRRMAQGVLPDTLDLKRKQGFSIPLNEWLRETGCEAVHDSLAMLPDVINRGEVQRLIDGHQAGRANGGRLFALLMLAMAGSATGGWGAVK